VFALFAPIDRVVQVAPGLDLDVHRESADGHWEGGGSVRVGYGADSSGTATSMTLAMLSGGAKYFPGRLAETNAYFGAGVTMLVLDLQFAPPGPNFSGFGAGFGSYIDGGIELFRDSHSHLGLGARLDLPFFSLPNQNAPGPAHFYYAPLSLEGRITF
jgi:hypothetical protein